MFNGASTQFMSINDNAALSMGTGVFPTLVGWFYPLSTSSARPMSKGSGAAAATEYYLIWNASAFSFRISNGVANLTSAAASANLNAWSFVVAYYDGATIGTSVNLGPFQTAVATADIQDSTAVFRFGTDAAGASAFTGAINQGGIAKSILSATELAELYNGGKGKSFAQLSASLAAKFSAYWDLDDAGGSAATWSDKASTNHLTAAAGAAAPSAVILKR